MVEMQQTPNEANIWIGLLLSDAQGKILAVNPEMAAYLKQKPTALIGKKVSIIAPKGYKRSLTDAIKGALNARQPQSLTFKSKGRLFEVRLTPFLVEGTPSAQCAVAILDITTTTKAREKLIESEERFRTTLMSIGDAVITTDQQGRIMHMNPIAEQLTGWTESEARGKPLEKVFRIINEESGVKVESPVSRVLREGVVVGLANHTLLIDRKGKAIPIADSGAPIFNDAGEIGGVVLVFRDQTEERRKQKAIREARQFAESIVSTIREPLLVLDPQLYVITANPAFYSTFETDAENTEGELVFELGDRQWDIPSLRSLLEDILPGNTSFNDYEVTHNFERIGKKTMLLNARRIHYEGEKTDFILLAFEDITRRRAAEEQAKEQQARLAKAQQVARMGFLDWDLTTDRIFLSDQVLEMYGLEADKKWTTPELVSQVVHPEDLESVRQHLEMAMRGEKEYDIDHRVVRPDGGVLWVHAQAELIYDESGKPVRLLGTVVDISERQRLYTELQASEARARFFSENTLEAILIHENGVVVDVNQRGPEMSGYSREELLGMNILELAAPESRPLILEKLKSGYQGAYEAVGQRKDGSTFPCELTARNLEWEGRSVRMVIIQDLSERKEAEEALHQSEALYRTLFENLPIGVGIADQNGRLVEYNQAMLLPGGYTRKDIKRIGNVANLYYDPKERETILKKVTQGGSVSQELVRFKRKDGTPYEAYLWLTPVTYQGQPCLQAMVEDVTERMRSQRELEALAMVSQSVAEELELQPLLERLLNAARHAIPAGEKGSVLLTDADGKLRIQALAGYQDRAIYALTFAGEGGYSALVAREKQARIFPDARGNKSIRYDGDLEEVRQVKSAIAVPLTVQERLVGVLSLDNASRKSAFTEEDLNTLTHIAPTLALAIENARLFERTRLQAKQQETLYRISTRLAESLDTQEICAQAIEALGKELGYRFAGVFLVDAESGERVLQAQYGWENAPAEWRLKPGEGVSSHAVESGKIQYWPDAPGQPEYIPALEDTHSELDVPIKSGEQVIGVLVVEDPKKDAFTTQDFDLVQAVANILAVTLEKARLFEETSHRAAEFKALLEIAVEISQEHQLDTLLHSLIQHTMNLFQTSYGGVYLFDAQNNTLQMAAAPDERVPHGTILQVGEGMAGKVIQTRQPLIVEDYRTWEGRASQYEGIPFTSILEMPMMYQNQPVGVLVVNEFAPRVRKFGQRDVDLLSLIATFAAGAVHNARLLEETRRRLHEVQTLMETTSAMASLEITHVLETIAQQAKDLFEADGCRVMLLEADGETLKCEVALHEKAELMKATRLKIGQGVTGSVVASGNAEIVNDMLADSRSLAIGNESHPNEAMMLAPLESRGNPLGVITVSREGTAHPFEPRELEVFQTLALHASVAIENARMFADVRNRMQELNALQETALGITTLDLEEVLKVIGTRTASLLRADDCLIFLREKDESLCCVFAHSPHADAILGMELEMGKGITGAVAQSGKAEIVNNPLEDPRAIQAPGTPQEEECLMFAPIRHKEEIIGVLSVARKGKEHPFQRDELGLLRALAAHAAAAISNARAFAQTRRRSEEFQTLYAVTRQLAMESDLRRLLHTVASSAAKLLGTDSALVFSYDPANRELTLEAKLDDILPENLRLMLGEGMAGQVAKTGQAMAVEDYHLWDGRSIQLEGFPFGSVLEVPMKFGGRLMGVLGVYNLFKNDDIEEEEIRHFSEEDIRLLSLFASAAAGAIASAQQVAKVQMHLEELRALFDTATLLRGVENLSQVLPKVLQIAVNASSTSTGMFTLLRPEEKKLYVHSAVGKLEKIKNLKIGMQESICGYVVQNKRDYIFRDLANDEHTDQRYRRLVAGIRGGVCLPLQTEEGVIGTLLVANYGNNMVPEEKIRLLTSIADMAAMYIHRQHLHQRTETYARQLESINALGRELAATLELQRISQTSFEYLQKMGMCDSLTIYRYDEEQNALHVISRLGEQQHGTPPADHPLQLDLNDAEDGRATAIASGQVVQPQINQATPASEGSKYRQVAYVPMLVEGKTIGLLELERKRKMELKSDDLAILSMIATQIGLALRNANLFAETQENLNRLNALHKIDIAITSSMDMQLTMNVLLEQVIAELGVSAAAVHLLNPSRKQLVLLAMQGGKSRPPSRLALRLDEDICGQAVLERKRVQKENLSFHDLSPQRRYLIESEGFVSYIAVPLIAKGVVLGALELFDQRSMQASRSWLNFLENLSRQAAIAIDNTRLFADLEKSRLELAAAYDATIEGWSKAMELRDHETEGHTLRVTDLSVEIGKHMGMSQSELLQLRRGALLHDIGKIGIPDQILLKPGKLNAQEWELMRRHPQIAYDMLYPIAYLRPALDVPLYHHEKWDGSGYPHGFKGEQIPLAARIFAVADVYDALISDRPYRKAWPREKALEYIRDQSGAHFDPKVVEVFLRLIDQFHPGR